MSRSLVALAVIESAVIVVLVLMLATRPEPIPGHGPVDAAGRTEDEAAAPVIGSGAGAGVAPAPHGEAPPRERAPVQREAVVLAPDPDDPVGLILWGRVTALDGAKLPESQVTLRCAEKKREEWARVRNGAYAVVGLTPGKWKVTSKLNGYASFEREVELDGSSPRTRLDIVLTPAYVVRVRIMTPEGKRFGEALRAHVQKNEVYLGELAVFATEEAPAGNFPISAQPWGFGVGQWRPVGHYDRAQQLPKEFAGELELKQPPPLWVSAALKHVVLDTKRLEAGESEITLTVAIEALQKCLATVRLQVVDGVSGQPLAGARVAISEGWGGGGPETKDDGRVVLTNVRPGLAALHVAAKGYEQFYRQLQIEAGEMQDLGQVRVFKAETLKGTVVDAVGKPVIVDIQVSDLDAVQGVSDFGSLHCRSDSDGVFSLLRAGRRRYVFRVTDKDSGCVVQLVDATQGPPEDLRIRLQPSVAVKVVKESAVPISVLVRDARGLPVQSFRLNSKTEREMSFAAGTYRVEVSDGLRPAASLTLNAVAGEILRLP